MPYTNRVANLGEHAQKQDLATRFWSYVDKSPGQGPQGECWVWKGKLFHKKPYGQVQVDGKTRAAHRVAFELQKGPIPPGKQVCHTCDNPPCQRGDHLFTGTTQDNTADKVSKNRQARGETIVANRRSYQRTEHPNAKFTETQIIEIRASALSYGKLAAQYGVSKSTIAAIKTNRNWREDVREISEQSPIDRQLG
jgi:hypothetical protein